MVIRDERRKKKMEMVVQPAYFTLFFLIEFTHLKMNSFIKFENLLQSNFPIPLKRIRLAGAKKT